MASSRIHIQPCTAGYTYRIGSNGSLHVARRDDLSSRLYDDIHALHLMARGHQPHDAAREVRLIRRIVYHTAQSARARKRARYALPQGNEASCQEPACTYLPEPDEDEEWTVEYDVESARRSVVHAPPLRCRSGHPAYPVVVEVTRPDGSQISDEEWERHVEGIYAAAQNDMRYVEEPPERYTGDGAAYWQLLLVYEEECGGSEVYLLELGERAVTPYWSNLEPTRRFGPVQAAEAARLAEARSAAAGRMVWLPPKTLRSAAWERLARTVAAADEA